MSDPIEFASTDDPLFRGVPLDHRTMIPVLGIRVRFATNAAAVLDAVESAFRAWRVLETVHDEDADAADAHVTIIVHPDDVGSGKRVQLRHRVLGPHRILFTDGANAAVVDPERREARAWVTPSFVADAQHFRYTLVEAITMALLTPLDRQPFHAACLVRDNSAVLLTGPSGVGKSSLAFAAALRMPGVAVLAEDAVYLQAEPRLRVWGLPGFAHLPSDIVRIFPDLAVSEPVVLANGKTKIAADLRGLGVAAALPFVDRAALCLLTRGERSPGLKPIAPDALLERLLLGLEDGFDLFADTITGPLRKLTRHGGWLLELPPNPIDALDWLDRILREIETAAA